MWLVEPVPDDEVDPALRKDYEEDLSKDGYIWNTSRVWSHRPELFELWKQLFKPIRSHLRLRTYELITLAAARAMGCTYCMLAHGSVLRKNGFTAEQVIAILKDHHTAGLAPVEVHLMDYADKISRDSKSITQADIDMLHADGLSDQQITDAALAATARNFISRFFDSQGAGPDPELIAAEPELWAYLESRGVKALP